MPNALTTGTTGQAAQAEGQSAKAAPSSQQQQIVPWVMAALEASEAEFAIGPTALAAAAPTPIPTQLLLSDAWLVGIEVIVTVTAAGNADDNSVVFAADAPFNIIQLLQVQDPGGAQILAPHSGYQLFAKQKYGAFRIDPPYCDPRLDPCYTLVAGEGANGGSASFRLFIPFACRPFDVYGALANADSGRQYKFSMTAAPSSVLYTTAPTNPPTITITGTGIYRLNPPSTLAGKRVQPNPPWYTAQGAARVYLDVVTPPVPSSVAGNIGLQLNIQGRIIREIIMIARNDDGVRIGAPGDGTYPDTTTWVFNKFPRFVLGDLEWVAEMAEAYGYSAVDAGGTFTLDAAGTLDTGVRVLHQFMLTGSGKVKANQTGFGWLQTVSGSQILQQGQWGVAVESLEVLVTDIAPGPVPGALFIPTAIS